MKRITNTDKTFWRHVSMIASELGYPVHDLENYCEAINEEDERDRKAYIDKLKDLQQRVWQLEGWRPDLEDYCI